MPDATKTKYILLTLKKIYIFLFAILLVSAFDANAQRRRNNQVIKAYPSIGFTASQIRGDELRGFKKWGMSAGVGAIIDLADRGQWQLSVEADFAQRGAFNNTNDPYSLIDFTMNYVDIPLTLHFTDPYGGMTFGLGFVYSRLVQQPHGMIFYSPAYFVPDTGDMGFLRNDFSIAADIRFPIWRGLTLNVRYQHSFMPIKKNWHFTEHYSTAENDFKTWSNDCYNSSVTVRLLYVFGDQPRKKYANKNHYKKRKR
jgi:hypothetical protein